MKLPAFLFLLLSSVVGSSVWACTESPQGGSTSSSPSTENVIAFQTYQDTVAYGGRLIHIAVPRDVLSEPAGTTYDLASEPDYLQMVQPAAAADSNR